MRVFISVDMEGVSGVVHNEHTSERGYDYETARRLMMGEANAAVEGAVAGGATHVLVADQHGGNGARNLIISDLHPAADLISGYPRPVPLADLLEGFDLLCLVGQHARSGAAGVINHTVHGRVIGRLRIGGKEVGESGLGALQAGQVGVPVGLVTGDDRACAEAQSLMPWIEAAVVKWAVNRYSARCLSPTVAQERIRASAERAVRRMPELAIFDPAHPATWEIAFKDSGMAQVAAQVPGVTMVGTDTVRFNAPDATTGYRTFTVALGLGAATLQ